MNVNLMLRTKNTGQLNIDRVFARLFVILGGIFWIAATFTAGTVMKSYTNQPFTLPELQQGATTAFFPLVLIVAVFVLGMFYERLTGVVLVIVSIAMVIYGFFLHSPFEEPVLWVTAFSMLVLPSLVAAGLYELAARRQEQQELQTQAA